MSESPKVELVFQYTRGEDGLYTGSADLVESVTGTSLRPPLFVALQRPEWVRFVVETIRLHDEIEAVAFDLKKPDHTKYRYRLDRRTVEKIKTAALDVDDMIL